MKLIHLITISLWFSQKSYCQKFPPEQFPFPPQFKSPNSPNGAFGSDKSIYLPPESHTAMPYFPMNNGNGLPFQFLPPTATKAPSIYPSPFPMVMSSTMASRNDEDDHETEARDSNKPRHQQFSNHLPPNFRNKNDTHIDKNIEHSQERDMRSIPKNFNFQNANDRIDIKLSPQLHAVTQRTLMNQTPASQRRMIISSEILKNDHGFDQIKRASILGPQSISSPITYYSTTEPAIPILRLSNEMDLDGSFSYEALGADQTHYVQHSRMENSGTEKEEQVVEGSYSYVGDNGQTYTVHYVADSNGYRASGDHLPVPPPIPEIIQRSIQYNLAEEAKKPVHLKSWQENEKEYENESEKHRFSILPPRNLFTGRTPEAFSFGLTQSSVLQNKIANDDSSQASSKINFDFTPDQSKVKVNNGPITPQITFLASQGAHKPTVNSGQQQQQVQRIFSTDKPTLPQLMNYEAGISESDQENNKALWRWQYGLNANGAVENQHPNKNSISRSFGEGDDVIINFNNMSPEQYTKIIKNEFLEHNTENSVSHNESPNKESINTVSTPLYNPLISDNKYSTVAKQNDVSDQSEIYKYSNNIPHNEHQSTATDNTMIYSTVSDWSKHMDNMQYNDKITDANNNFVTATPLSTPSYKYSEESYESTKLKPHNIYMTTNSPDLHYKSFDRENEVNINNNNVRSNTENLSVLTTYPSNDFIVNNENNIKFTDFIQREDKSNFKPIVNIEFQKENTQDATTTTESSPESIIRNNIFLKNLFNPGNAAVKRKQDITEEPKKLYHNKVNIEPKLEKVPKLIQFQSKPQNEIKHTIKKPLDMADVLNYITFKNHFESNKLKSKPKISHTERLGQRLETPQIFIPIENDTEEEEEQLDQEESQNHLRTLNNQKQQELRGIIKNYKVLHRPANTKNMGQSKDQLMTDPSQRHLKAFQTQNLPPLGRAGPSMKSYLPPTYL